MAVNLPPGLYVCECIGEGYHPVYSLGQAYAKMLELWQKEFADPGGFIKPRINTLLAYYCLMSDGECMCQEMRDRYEIEECGGL